VISIGTSMAWGSGGVVEGALVHVTARATWLQIDI
jgi:hypothetical protein